MTGYVETRTSTPSTADPLTRRWSEHLKVCSCSQSRMPGGQDRPRRGGGGGFHTYDHGELRRQLRSRMGLGRARPIPQIDNATA